MNTQERCVGLQLLREIFNVGLYPHRLSRNNVYRQVIPHIHYPLAEGKLAQIKPRSIESYIRKW